MGYFDDFVEWAEDTSGYEVDPTAADPYIEAIEDVTGYEADPDAWGAEPAWPGSSDAWEPDPDPDPAPPVVWGAGDPAEAERQRKEDDRLRREYAAQEEKHAWACLVNYQQGGEADPLCPSDSELAAWVEGLSEDELTALNCEAFGEDCPGEETEPERFTEPEDGGTGGGGTGGGGTTKPAPKDNTTLYLVGGGAVVLVGLGITAAVMMRKPKRRAA